MGVNAQKPLLQIYLKDKNKEGDLMIAFLQVKNKLLKDVESFECAD
jgi:hypothetical protein